MKFMKLYSRCIRVNRYVFILVTLMVTMITSDCDTMKPLTLYSLTELKDFITCWTILRFHVKWELHFLSTKGSFKPHMDLFKSILIFFKYKFTFVRNVDYFPDTEHPVNRRTGKDRLLTVVMGGLGWVVTSLVFPEWMKVPRGSYRYLCVHWLDWSERNVHTGV